MTITTEYTIAPDAEAPGSLIGLGRLPAIDERSRSPRFAMAAPRTQRTHRTWASLAKPGWPAVLDQGATSECVAYSCSKFLLSSPIVNIPKTSCNVLYRRAQELDEWPGTNYDGTSVNAGMKVLREQGLISGWTWAFEVQAVVRHLLEIGPVVLGTDWTRDMFTPDRWGYIWPTGSVDGGHAYEAIGANMLRRNPDKTTGAIRLLNSWGPNWGDNGRAWMSLEALAKLLQGLAGWPGEAAAITEVKIR